MKKEHALLDAGVVFDAAVIGAGFAGLSAVEKLREDADLGNIVLLEGRRRVGGRASDGPGGARGAELVYSRRVMDLAKRHGLDVEVLPDEWEGSHFLTADGAFCKTEMLGLFSGEHLYEVLGRMKTEMQGERRNISVQEFLSGEKSPTYRSLRADEQALICRIVEGEYAANLGSIGIASFQPNSDTFNSEMVGRIPNGGYEALARKMELDIRRRDVRVRCNAIVDRVSHADDRFSLHINGQDTSLQSRTVVVAVPSAVLQKGTMRLPCPLPETMETIGQGNACKVLCSFDAPPWPDDFHFAYSMRAPFCYAWPRSEGKRHTLTLYISGSDAEEFRRILSQRGGRKKAIAQIRSGVEAMFGNAAQLLRDTDIDIVPWKMMPQSRTSYGFTKADDKPMENGTHKNFLSTSINGIVLAGEAYANSTVDGAVASGTEAAMHIRKLLKAS